MFALALWDALERTLTPCPRPLRREAALLRLGRQGLPLRLRAEGAAASIREFDNPVEPPRAAPLCASRAYVPAPLSIYERIFKLPPGCILTVTREACEAPRDRSA